MKHAIIIAALWLMASQNAHSQTTNKSDEFLLKESTSAALKRAPGTGNTRNTDNASTSRLLAKAESVSASSLPTSLDPAVSSKSTTPAPSTSRVTSQNVVTQTPARSGGSLSQKLQSVRNNTLHMQDATKIIQANTRALLANTEAVRANSEALAANVRAMQANRHLRGEHALELAAANRSIVPAPSATNMRQPAPAPAPSKTYDKPAASATALVKAPAQPAPSPVAPAKAPAPLPAMPKADKPQPPVAAAPVKAPVAQPAPAPVKEVAKAPAAAPVAPAVAAAPAVAKTPTPAPAPVAAAPAPAPSKLPAPMPMAAVKAPATSPVLMSAAPTKMPGKLIGMREKMELSFNGKAMPAPKPTAAIPAPKVKSTTGTAVKNTNHSMPLDNLMLALNKAATVRTTMRKKNLMPGDIITTHGFLRVVSTEDSATEKETYVLQLTSGSQQNDTCFIVKISADELADDNIKETASHAKLFIRQLVKGRVPCVGGHIMRKPVFVTVTGELKYNEASAAAMKSKDPSYRGKRNLHSYTAWEMGQLNNIEFMTL